MNKLIGAVLGSILTLAIVAGGPVTWWWYDRHFQGYRFGGVTFLHLLAFTVPPGVGVQLAAIKAEEASAGAKARRIEAAENALTVRAGQQETQAQTRILTVTRTITTEIPRYVTAEIDRSYPLSWGFVRVHDAAARGVDVSDVSLPAGQSDDDAASISPSDALAVITANYGACRQDDEQLAALIAWTRQAQQIESSVK